MFLICLCDTAKYIIWFCGLCPNFKIMLEWGHRLRLVKLARGHFWTDTNLVKVSRRTRRKLCRKKNEGDTATPDFLRVYLRWHNSQMLWSIVIIQKQFKCIWDGALKKIWGTFGTSDPRKFANFFWDFEGDAYSPLIDGIIFLRCYWGGLCAVSTLETHVP